MRKALFICGLLAALAGTVQSETVEEISTDLMQSIEDTNKELANDIALRDAKSSTRHANELSDMFKQVESHYVTKPDAQNAVDLTRKTLALTSKIVQQVGSANFDGATDSSTELSRTCKACHNFYKKD